MFCGNCGSKTLVGDRFCSTCGQAQRSPSASESDAAEAVESPPPADQTVLATQPGEKALYCRHSPSERTQLGIDMRNGSDICLGCRLPYSPDSPNSGFRRAAKETTRAGLKDDVDPLGNSLDANLTSQGGAGGTLVGD
jgi:hypothetical protein